MPGLGLGLGLGLGGNNSGQAPKYTLDLFTGFDSGSTFAGGPTTVLGYASDAVIADGQTLQTYPANTLPVVGARKTATDEASPVDASGAQLWPVTNIRTVDGTEQRYDMTEDGALIEPATSNLALWPQDASNVIWATASLSRDSESQYTATTTGTGVFSYQFITVTASTEYTFSFDDGGGTATGHTFAIYDNTHATFIEVDIPVVASSRNSITFTTPVGCVLIRCYRVRGVTSTGTVITDNAQLELGSFATSRVQQEGTIIPRPAGNLTRTWPTGVVNNFGIKMHFTPTALQDTTVLLSNDLAGTTTDLIQLVLYPTFIDITSTVSSVSGNVSVLYNHAADTPFEVMLFKHGATGMNIAVREYSGGSWSAWTWGTLVTSAAAKSDAAPGATYRIGSRFDGYYVTGTYGFNQIYNIPATADPQTWMEAQA